MTKTIVGCFDRLEDARRVADELGALGVAPQAISLVAHGASDAPEAAARLDDEQLADEDEAESVETQSDATRGAMTGGMVGGAAGLIAGLIGLTIPGIGPLVAAGPILGALSGAGAGVIAGGLIGGLRHVGVPHEHAGQYAEAVRRGGTLVAVHADAGRADEVARLMRERGAIDLDARIAHWHSTGWAGHDPQAAPFSPEEVERERAAWRTISELGRPGAGDGGRNG